MVKGIRTDANNKNMEKKRKVEQMATDDWTGQHWPALMERKDSLCACAVGRTPVFVGATVRCIKMY